MKCTRSNGYLGIMVCERQRIRKHGFPDHLDGFPEHPDVTPAHTNSSAELPFREQSFYRRLCLQGAKVGVRVFVFSPCRIDWALNKVWGYLYNAKESQWNKLLFPLPDLIYNRCFFTGRTQYLDYRLHIHKLIQNTNIRFLGVGLKGKWEVQQALKREPSLHAYLPPTEIYDSIKTILPWLRDKREVFLKPQGGSQGRGILHVMRTNQTQFQINGRDRHNRMLNMNFDQPFDLFHWIQHFINRKKYIIQPYLTLTNQYGEAFDIRSLVQKTGSGLWQITGLAVRRGKLGSITSNLHGGGRAEEVKPFLEAEFGKAKALKIISCIEKLSLEIPPVLEQSQGQLCELGIDFGVDHQGSIWILEVNSKPGRAVFAQLDDKKAILNSINNPIHYARYILDKQSGG